MTTKRAMTIEESTAARVRALNLVVPQLRTALASGHRMADIAFTVHTDDRVAMTTRAHIIASLTKYEYGDAAAIVRATGSDEVPVVIFIGEEGVAVGYLGRRSPAEALN